jgi:hypothetical protein
MNSNDEMPADNDSPLLAHDPPARRRVWLNASIVALPVAAIAAFATWSLQRPVYTATSVLRLSSQEKNLVLTAADAKPVANNAFEFYKRTQRQWLRSRFVLLRALRGENDDGTINDLARLPVFRDAPDPIDWLEENLNVSFPDESEVMHVSISNDRPEGLVDLVNAVVKAYFDEIVYAEGGDKRARLDGLDKAYHQAEDNLRAKRNEFKLLADRVGTGDEKALTLAQQNSINQFAAFARKLGDVRIDLLQAGVDLEAADAEISVSNRELRLALRADPIAVQIAAEKQQLVNQLQALQLHLKDGDADPFQEEFKRRLANCEEQYEGRRELLRQELIEDKREAAATRIDALKRKLESLKTQEELLKIAAGQLEAEMKPYGKTSIEVEMMRLELGTLEEIARDLSREFERTKVEVQADQRAGVARVTKKSPAQTARLQPQKARVAKTVGAGTLAFFVTIGLIVWLNARRTISRQKMATQSVSLEVTGS